MSAQVPLNSTRSGFFVHCLRCLFFPPRAENSVTLLIEQGFGRAGKNAHRVLPLLQAIDAPVAFEHGVLALQADDAEGAGDDAQAAADAADPVEEYC